MLAGRVVRPGEPAWTQQDTDLAIAITEIEAERCDGCGHPVGESMDPDTEFGWKADALRCHACAARDRKARGMGESFDDSGIRWLVTRKGR